MKKVIAVAVLLFASFEAVYAATYQPKRLGWVNLSIASMTATAVAQTSAPTVGYLINCYNCASNGGKGTICISTSTTAQNGFVLSTGTACN